MPPKIKSIFSFLLIVVFALAATPVLYAVPNPSDAKVLRTDGDPNGVVYALKGQLITDVSSPAIWYQAGASGTSGMVTLVSTTGAISNVAGVTIPAAGKLILSGTAVGSAGQLLISGTQFKIYLTTTTGILVTGTGVTTF